MRWISNTASDEASSFHIEPFLQLWPTRTGSALHANTVDQTMTSASMSTIQSAAAIGTREYSAQVSVEKGMAGAVFLYTLRVR